MTAASPPSPPSASLEERLAEPARTALLAALAAAPDAALLYDADGRLLAANDRACALAGLDHAALLARPLAEVVLVPADEARAGRSALVRGQSRRVEGACRRADGSSVAVEAHLARLALDGAPLYACHLRETAVRPPMLARDPALAQFLDSNPAACFQKDLAGRYQYANAACAQVLGMDPAGCLGRTDSDLFPREAAEAFRSRDRQVLESGEAVAATFAVPTAGGERRVLLHKFPVRDAAGTIIAVAGLASDLTERLAVEDRLRLREQQLAVFLENSPAACFQKDLEGRYQLINATCARDFEMDPATCIGRTDHELFAAEAADVYRGTDLEAIRRGDVYSCETQAPSPHGPRHFLAHKFPIRDAGGRIVSIAGTAVEITELKRADAALREAEAQLRSVVQGMPVLLDAFDEHGMIVAWNRECERVTGYSAAEIVGNPKAMSLLYPETAYLQAMMAEAEELRAEEYSRIFDLTTKDGSIRSIEWANLGARLKIPGWREWSVGIDVTERRRLEAALHEATVLEQRRLGHDLHDGLGQELTGLSLLASSLARRHAANPALAAEFGSLAEIAASAIGTCKNVARGLAPIEDAPHGLADALKRLTTGFADPDGSLRLSFDDESSAAPRISFEACTHLYRIAQEALTNAVRHAGARNVRIELSTSAELLRLRISDDGRGFALADAPSGGMGLRTMRHRANAIDARLSVGEGPDGGTVVTCDCPNRASPPQAFSG